MLNLAVNRLSGAIPEALGDLANLRRLLLWDNQLSGGIPASLSKLTELEMLELRREPPSAGRYPSGCRIFRS